MPEVTPSKYLVRCSWGNVPHLDEKTKAELRASGLPYLRDAREHGIPSLGSGAIYPVPETEITCDPFEIPAHWPRVWGLDVGWKMTAAVWAARDRNTDTVYLYSEHYRSQAEPSIHAAAIKARGAWIPGVVDPAARGRNINDGTQMIAMYRLLGLNIQPASRKEVETGLYETWDRLSTGRLKVFRTLLNFLNEYRNYRRDEKGKIVKEDDHGLDACRYLIISGLEIAIPSPFTGMPKAVASAALGDPAIGY